jgi:plastocyanin
MTRLHAIRLAAVVLSALSLGSVGVADEWAPIKGKFVFGGDPPSAGELKADKDVDVCGKHKLLAEELIVGADKGIANVVVFVRDKDVKVNPDAAKAAAGVKVTLDNKNCRFEPHIAVVQVGQDLVVKNSDTVGHNSNIATVKNPPSNNLIPASGEAAVKFASDEAVPAQVTCNIHPWMKGWLVVRPNPYAAVSKADGTFEIKDVPVGEVELQFWHEKAGYLGEMTIGGKAEKASKGRKKVAVAAGGTDLGEIVLAPAVFQK